jgi:hypothetical protein
MDVPASARLASDPQNSPRWGQLRPYDTEAGGLILKLRESEGVDREEVCGLLIGRLEDVSTRLCCIRCLAIQWLWP